jgi:hypothetical protein
MIPEGKGRKKTRAQCGAHMAVAAVSSRRVECGAVAGENEGCRRPGDEERGDAWPLSQHARVDLFVLVHTLSFPEWSPRLAMLSKNLFRFCFQGGEIPKP